MHAPKQSAGKEITKVVDDIARKCRGGFWTSKGRVFVVLGTYCHPCWRPVDVVALLSKAVEHSVGTSCDEETLPTLSYAGSRVDGGSCVVSCPLYMLPELPAAVTEATRVVFVADPELKPFEPRQLETLKSARHELLLVYVGYEPPSWSGEVDGFTASASLLSAPSYPLATTYAGDEASCGAVHIGEDTSVCGDYDRKFSARQSATEVCRSHGWLWNTEHSITQRLETNTSDIWLSSTARAMCAGWLTPGERVVLTVPVKPYPVGTMCVVERVACSGSNTDAELKNLLCGLLSRHQEERAHALLVLQKRVKVVVSVTSDLGIGTKSHHLRLGACVFFWRVALGNTKSGVQLCRPWRWLMGVPLVSCSKVTYTVLQRQPILVPCVQLHGFAGSVLRSPVRMILHTAYCGRVMDAFTLSSAAQQRRSKWLSNFGVGDTFAHEYGLEDSKYEDPEEAYESTADDKHEVGDVHMDVTDGHNCTDWQLPPSNRAPSTTSTIEAARV